MSGAGGGLTDGLGLPFFATTCHGESSALVEVVDVAPKAGKSTSDAMAGMLVVSAGVKRAITPAAAAPLFPDDVPGAGACMLLSEVLPCVPWEGETSVLDKFMGAKGIATSVASPSCLAFDSASAT